MLRLRSLCFAALMGLSATGAHAADIVIGQVAPFTGTLAPTGKGISLGIQAYVARVNATGGIRGNRLRLVTRDDAYKAEQTVAQTRDLLATESPVALVGFVGTGNALALQKDGILDAERIPLVGVRTGALALRRPAPAYMFHTRASYAAEVQRVIDQMQGMGLKRIAVFHQDDPFGQDGLDAAKARLGAAGLELVATGSYPKGTTEVADAVRAIHAADPNGVIMVSNTAASAAFVKGMKDAGSFALMITLSVTAGPQVAERIGKETAHGLGIVQVVPNPESEAIAISQEMGEDLKRIDSEQGPNHTVLEGYLMAKVLVEGIRRAATLDRAGITAALNTMDAYDAGGVTIRYRPDNHDGSEYTDLSILDRSGHLLR